MPEEENPQKGIHMPEEENPKKGTLDT